MLPRSKLNGKLGLVSAAVDFWQAVRADAWAICSWFDRIRSLRVHLRHILIAIYALCAGHLREVRPRRTIGSGIEGGSGGVHPSGNGCYVQPSHRVSGTLVISYSQYRLHFELAVSLLQFLHGPNLVARRLRTIRTLRRRATTSSKALVAGVAPRRQARCSSGLHLVCPFSLGRAAGGSPTSRILGCHSHSGYSRLEERQGYTPT